jgi:hypothetical protein
MPSLASFGLDLNPSREPLRYPGTLVRRTCLLAGAWLYAVTPRAGVPVGGWRLAVDGGPLADPASGDGRPASLAAALQVARSASMDERFPVVAVGSNASPGQLAHKFTSGPLVSELVPMTRARVRGVAVGHSAHVSKAGYVPYVPLACAPDVRRELFVLWLDRTQLDRVNETEPNYHPVTVGRESAPALLEGGQRLEVFSLYQGRWGALRPAADQGPVEAGSQEAVYAVLAALGWFRELVPEVSRGVAAAAGALADDELRRVEVRERLAAAKLAAPDGLTLPRFAPVPYPDAVAGPLT